MKLTDITPAPLQDVSLHSVPQKALRRKIPAVIAVLAQDNGIVAHIHEMRSFKHEEKMLKQIRDYCDRILLQPHLEYIEFAIRRCRRSKQKCRECFMQQHKISDAKYGPFYKAVNAELTRIAQKDKENNQ